jgi:ADP-ribose pyrophosphatase YjhB (NUDIX family)
MGAPKEISAEILASRTSYIKAIESIVPNDSTEAADIRDSLLWLKSEPQIHKPHNMKRHLGVIFLVLSPDRKKTFMLNHRKAQAWLPPGGHVDTGLSFQDAVRLEMREELKRHAVFVRSMPFFLTNTATRGLNAGHIDTTAWFLVEGDPTKQYTVSEKEASESAWMELSRLKDMPSYTHLPRAFKKLPQYLTK